MKTYSYTSHSEDETRLLGLQIGQHIQSCTCVGLNGTLGSGKTRLVKSIGEGLELDPETVVSPTFTICVPHQGRLKMLHLDAYRLRELEEVDELGLDEEIERGAILLVEWAEKIDEALPPIDLEINATPVGDQMRQYDFVAKSEIGETLLENITRQLKN